MNTSQPVPDTLGTPQAPPEVHAAADQPMPQSFLNPPRRSPMPAILATVGILILLGVLALVIVYLISGLGTTAFAIAGVLALVPLFIVLLGVRWIDRWDPEPAGALVFAFLWGAGMSVLIALIVGAELEQVVAGTGAAAEFVGAAIQAPIVEEVGKGFGVLLLFWFARKNFSGPVDGIVYAAVIAGGFAFTENILYFGSALLESGTPAGLVEIFLIRGLMSPFAHVMFTAFIGIFLGLAANRTGALGAIGFFIVGLIPAVLLHAFWNGALFFVPEFYSYFAIVQFPLFALVVVLVIYLRRQEAKLTRARLGEYADAGWFNPEELDALATPSGRKVALDWARKRGVGDTMKRYISAATKLAHARQRMMVGRGVSKAQADEARHLSAIVESRKALQGTMPTAS